MLLLQNHIEAAEKSQRTIVSECVSLEQQLSTSETNRAALREQYVQLNQEVEGYQNTIKQHVALAASAKVRNLASHFVWLFFTDSFSFSVYMLNLFLSCFMLLSFLTVVVLTYVQCR